jgi:hypothetical protein
MAGFFTVGCGNRGIHSENQRRIISRLLMSRRKTADIPITMPERFSILKP